MKFWASVEAYKDAYPAMRKVRQFVEPFLNAAFAASSLATFRCKLRYVPIIMPEGMRERYPARSRSLKKDRIYDCAPQLDYDVFLTGIFKEQLVEYLRGISLSAPHLGELGASNEQIEDFENIVATAAERILADNPELQ